MYPTVTPGLAVESWKPPTTSQTIVDLEIQSAHERKVKMEKLVGRTLQQGEIVDAIEEQLKLTRIEEEEKRTRLRLEDERARSYETGYETATPDQILDYKPEEWELVGPKLGVEQKGIGILYRRKMPTANVATEDRRGTLTYPTLQDASAPPVEEKNVPVEPVEPEQKQQWILPPRPAWLAEFYSKRYEMVELTVEEFYQQQCKENEELWYTKYYEPAKEAENPAENEERSTKAKEKVHARRLRENARVGRDENGKCTRDV